MFTLVRESVAPADAPPTQQSWPVRITATLSADGSAANVFVYHTASAPIADQDFFSCVAGAPQMTELPVGSGTEGVPFYRTSAMLVHCRSADHADELWGKVRGAVQELADNLSLVDALSVEETVTITPDA